MTADLLRLDNPEAAMTEELGCFAQAFNAGDERAIDNAEADFDNLIACLDAMQQSDAPDADRASLAILQANAARQAILDGWAEV